MATDAENKSGENAEVNKEKVTFTPEQQARIDELIKEAMGRAGREVKTELETTKTKMQGLEAELSEAKKVAARAKGSAAKDEADDEVARLAAEIAEMKSANVRTHQEMENLRKLNVAKEKEAAEAKTLVQEIKKHNAIQAAAAKQNFVDVGIITKLTSEFIRFNADTGKFEVLNESGQPRYNPAYEPMTLDEFYSDYAHNNPYLVKGTTKSGSGSAESQKTLSIGQYPLEDIFGPNSKPNLANKIALANKKEYLSLRAQARERGLIK